MNSWKVILATVVIFGAGVLTGTLITQYTLNLKGPRHARAGVGFHGNESGSPGGMRLEFLRRIQRELDLDQQQQERIDALLRQSQERTRKLMEPVGPQLRQELQRAKTEFREALTPAQQERFDQLLKQQQKFKEHRQAKPEGIMTNLSTTNSI